LRGMQGAPHRQARSSARSFFLLPSVLALLALALFPVLAHAETAGGANYETELPQIESTPSTGGNHTGNSATHHKSSNNPPAKGSEADTESGGGVSSEGSEGEGSGSKGHQQEGSSSKEEESNPATGGGGGGNKPNGGGAEGAGKEGSISGAKEVAPAPATGTNASKSSGGGSSPVVPILIAVVVLAAISIGVVLYRQRKSGQGGSDGRVSSSNAS
jgi:cobalamin biosynthesis Mg chelatase CobN